MLPAEESPGCYSSTEEWDLIKSCRKEGGSVRKCHKEGEVLVGNSKQRPGEKPRRPGGSPAWLEHRWGRVSFAGQRVRQRPDGNKS